MTIESAPSERSYAGNGVTLAFAIPFPFDTSADIRVFFTNSSGTPTEQTTGFSISGGGGSTGTCTFLVAPANLTRVTILDDPQQTQPVDYISNDAFPAETHEKALDRVTRLVKRLNQRVDRSIRVADGDDSSGNALLLPIESSRAGKFLGFDANGLPIASTGTGGGDSALRTDLASTAVGADGSRLGGYRRTETGSVGRTVNSKLAERFSVQDFGALLTGADETTKLQAAIDALNAGTIGGGELLAKGDANSVSLIATSLTFPKRASGDNHKKWYAFRGNGRGGPRITATTGMANKVMLDMSGTDIATLSYYREVSDLYLNGAAIAQGGIDLRFNQHFRLNNLFITSMLDGAGTGYGIRINGAICAEFIGVKVHDSAGHGIWADGGSANFTNACNFIGGSCLHLTGSGLKITGGFSGCNVSGNTFEFCGEYGIDLAGYSGTVGSISGNYLESNGLGDIRLGSDTTCNAIEITGNYLNGYSAGVSNTAYTPVTIKFADGVRLIGNMVNVATKSTTGYYFLDANVAGGSVSKMVVENNQVRNIPDATPPNQIYNLPGSWVSFGNRLVDPIFAPLICNNVNRGRLPFGGWSISLAGAGTAARGADIFGAPSIRMTRPGGPDTSQISKVFTIGKEFKNRFVTVAVPILSACASLRIDVSITPNGTSPQSTTISTSTLANGDQTIVYAMGFAPADATTITVVINLFNGGTDFTVGHPCLYVGAQQWYSAQCDQDWVDDSTPATGTWVRGDKVYKASMTASTKMGVACVTGGTPGTWKDMPSLGA